MNAPGPVLSAEERRRVDHIRELSARGDVARLSASLSDPSWAVRRELVAALSHAGDAAVPALRNLIVDGRADELAVAAAVDALVASTGASVESALLPLLASPVSAVACDAARVLGGRKSQAATGVLVELSHHADENVAVAALEALGSIGGREAVGALVAAAESGSSFLTFPAIELLGRSGDARAVPALAALLGMAQFALEAARALGRTGGRSAVQPLAALLERSGDKHARVVAVALAEIKERHRLQFGAVVVIEDEIRRRLRAPRRLVSCLEGADPEEQVAICGVLGCLDDREGIPALSRLLSATPAVAGAAAAALKRLTSGADQLLLAALGEGDGAHRAVLLPLLGGRASAIAAVQACLDDPDAGVRAQACAALRRIGNVEAVPALFRMLGDADPRVVQVATAAIQSMGGQRTESLANAAARSPDGKIKRTALRVLGYFGFRSALAPMLEALADPDERVRDTAIAGLAFVDDPRAVESLLELAGSAAPRLRAAAMRALGHVGSTPEVVRRLCAALSDEDAWTRYYAAQALGRLRCEEAAPRLVPLLADPAGQVQVAAVEALSQLRAEEAFTALTEAARSLDEDVRRAALVGLGLTARAEAGPILVAAAGAGEAATRLVAVSALTLVDPVAAAPVLVAASHDADEHVRSAAISLLGQQPGAAATVALCDLLREPDIRDRVVKILGQPNAGRVDGLVSALRAGDAEAAPHILSALSRIGNPPARSAIIDAVSEGTPAVRKAALPALEALDDPQAHATLVCAARLDIDPEVRRLAELALKD